MNLQWAITVTYSKTAREISAFHGFRFFARRSHKDRERISIRQRKGETKSERSSVSCVLVCFRSAALPTERAEAKWKKEKYSPTTLYFLPPLPCYSLLAIVSLLFISFRFICHRRALHRQPRLINVPLSLSRSSSIYEDAK